MGRLIKYLLYLVILAFIVVLIYAFVGDLTPQQELIEEDVVLDGA